MKHLSQIYTGTTYRVLDSLEGMKGRTVKGVFKLSNRATAFVNEGTILVLDMGKPVMLDNISTEELANLKKFTDIGSDQLI